MKRSLFVLALLAAVTLLGCQHSDDSLVNPATPSTTTRIAKNVDNCISVNTVLHVPGEFNSFLELKGRICYDLIVIPRDPILPNPQYNLHAAIALDASLRPFGALAPEWASSGTSQDVVPISDGESFRAQKRYRITGLNLNLLVTYRISVGRNGVCSLEMEAMDLERRTVGAVDDTN